MHSYTKGLLCSTAAAALMASAPAQANDMNEVRAELQNLLDRMERIEQSQSQQQVAETSAIRTNRTYIRKRAPQMQDQFRPYDVRDLYIMPENARANGVVGGDLPGSFKLPGSDTSVSISGWLTMGVNYDGGTSEGAFSTMGHAGTIKPGRNNSAGGSAWFMRVGASGTATPVGGFSISDNKFTIKPPSQIRISTPNGGERIKTKKETVFSKIIVLFFTVS